MRQNILLDKPDKEVTINKSAGRRGTEHYCEVKGVDASGSSSHSRKASLSGKSESAVPLCRAFVINQL